MDRVNQRTNHLLGQNIRKLRLEKNIRNKDMVAQLQLHGIDDLNRDIQQSRTRPE